VIGAGFAGLSCAYELLQSQQFNVVVLEARDRIGGRVWTVKQTDFEFPATTTDHQYRTVERGGELIGLNHFFWLTYADKFGLHMDYLADPSLEEEPEEADKEDESKEMYEYMKLIFQELDKEAAKLILYDEKGVDIATKPWLMEKAKQLDNISLEDYLNNIQKSYQGCTLQQAKEKGFDLPKFEFEKFKEVMDAAKHDFENNNGLPCNEQSLFFNLITIANGNRKIDKQLFNNLSDNINLEKESVKMLSFWDDAELFRCREGNGALAVKFAHHVEALGGQILLKQHVERIQIKQDDVQILLEGNHKFNLPNGAKIEKIVWPWLLVLGRILQWNLRYPPLFNHRWDI